MTMRQRTMEVPSMEMLELELHNIEDHDGQILSVSVIDRLHYRIIYLDRRRENVTIH